MREFSPQSPLPALIRRVFKGSGFCREEAGNTKQI